MIDMLGVAQTDLAPTGTVLVRGEIWQAHATTTVPKGSRVRVRRVDGLTLEVEPVAESR
jgi:membrane-bound serine protease (ClpP class)